MKAIMSYFADLEEHVHILSVLGSISYAALWTRDVAPKDFQVFLGLFLFSIGFISILFELIGDSSHTSLKMFKY